MIESLFRQKTTLERLQSGPLAEHLPFIAAVLQKEHYPPETVRRYLRVADRFGRWMFKNGLLVTEADETTVARYRTSTGRRQTGQLREAGRGLAKILALLRKHQVIDEPVHVAGTEGDTLVAAFDSHLQRVAGLMPGTRSQYLRYTTVFAPVGFTGCLPVFADPEHGMAVRTTANPLTENSFTMNVHARPKGGAGQLQPIRGRLGLASIA